MANWKGIYYRRRGKPDLPPAVFIHGAAGNGSLWLTTVKHLYKKLYSIVPDLPGHGRSTEKGPFSDIGQYAEAVTEFIEGLGIKRVLLVGHSMGGAISMEIALRRPDLVAGLVLVSTGARLRVHPAFINTLKEDPQTAVEFIVHAIGNVKNKEEIASTVKKAFLDNISRSALADFLACDSFDRMEDVSRINAPVLILCGKEDALTPLKYSYFLKDKIKNSVLVTFNKCGHMLMMENPSKVAKEIIKFAEHISW